MRCDGTRSHVNRNKFLAVNTLDPEEEQEGEKPRDIVKFSWLLQSNKTDVTTTTENIFIAPLINIDLRPTVIAERFNGKHEKPTLH